VLVTSTGHALQVITINLLNIWERYDALCFCVQNWRVLVWWLCVAICFAGRNWVRIHKQQADISWWKQGYKRKKRRGERLSGNGKWKKTGEMKGGRKELKRESRKDSGWSDTLRPARWVGRLTNIKGSMGRASRQITETCKHASLIMCWRNLHNYYVILNILVISPYDISLLCSQIQTSQYMYLNGRLTLNGRRRFYSHKTDDETPILVQWILPGIG